MQVFSGTCGNLTSIRCSNPTGLEEPIIESFSGLTIGETYYFRVYDEGGITNVTFNICINSAIGYIDNDDCINATNIVPEPGNSTCAYKQSSLMGATASLPEACYGGNEDDIWFKFTATSTRHQIWVISSQPIYPCIELFSGSCSNLVSIGCYNSTNGGSSEQVSPDITGLIPGNVYYYRVYGRATNNNRANTATCVKSLPAVPANDECAGAVAVPVNNNTSCSNNFTATIGGLTTESMPPCYGSSAKDLWYKFTATASTHRISINATTDGNLIMQSFSGSCVALTPIKCNYASGNQQPILDLMTGLTIGDTYFFRVYERDGATGTDFTICINAATTYIDNDECSGAIHIVPETGSSTCVLKSSNLTGATMSQPGACYGSNEDDVWYKFIATSSRHQIAVIANEPVSPVLELFSSGCGNLVSVGCYNQTNSDGNDEYIDTDITNLVPGNMYYYRVYGSSPNNNRCIISTCVKSIPIDATCPNTSISYRSEINGTSYQWQVNKGAGFTNIADDFIYQGSTTQQLQLREPPTFMYGYQYRCVVNANTYSNTHTLQFISYWNGSVSMEWEVAANWSCGWVPDENTDVVITSGHVYVNSSVSCRSINIKPQAVLELNTGYTIDIKRP
jgi:hypothetical protein